MMIPAVDQGYPNGRTAQTPGGIQTGEAATQNEESTDVPARGSRSQSHGLPTPTGKADHILQGRHRVLIGVGGIHPPRR